jgi:hypothetical protein
MVGMWFDEDQRANITNHVLKKEWTTSSHLNKQSTLNNEHIWEDLCIHLMNQQTYTYDNHHN